MTPLDLAIAFIAKGRQDEVLLERILDESDVADEIFAFHVQQALEKYIKAVLAVEQVRPTRTHDLVRLLADARGQGLDVPEWAEDLDAWSQYAVRDRYPTAAPAPSVDRARALNLVRSVRQWAEGAVRTG